MEASKVNVPARTLKLIIEQVKKQCAKYQNAEKSSGSPLHMAVIYTNKDGYLKLFGSEVITTILKECSESLLCSDVWKAENILSAPPNEVSILPKLPDRLEYLNCATLKSLVPLVTRILGNGGHIGWGKPDRKPEFWPEDVVFDNPKSKPEDQTCDGMYRLLLSKYS